MPVIRLELKAKPQRASIISTTWWWYESQGKFMQVILAALVTLLITISMLDYILPCFGL